MRIENLRRSLAWSAIGYLFLWGAAWAQIETDPAITGWYLNLDGKTGQSPDSTIDSVVSSIPADVQAISYNPTDVYMEATGIPSHPVGPFNDGNPAIPVNLDWLIRVPRAVPNEDPIHAETSLGAIGMFVNGIPMYNMSDAQSWNDQGIWNNNAIVVRASGFDAALGHPSPLNMGPPPPPGTDPRLIPYLHTHPDAGLGYFHTHTYTNSNGVRVQVDGEYHYHQQSPALRAQLGDDGSRHSPILGYAFDGFPMYGPYGYANTDGTGGVARMQSSYRLRNVTVRHTLPDGTMLPSNEWGPDVSETYPLGYFIEDFEYVQGLGDLDEYNGRFAVTPEFPSGVYAYYATIDSEGNSAFPYLLGPSFYGMPLMDDMTNSVVKPGGLTVYGIEDEADALRDAVADSGGQPVDYEGAKAFLTTLTLAQFAVIDVDGNGTVTLDELLQRTVGETGTALQVWVDFTNHATGQDGTSSHPFDTVAEANGYVSHSGNGVISIVGPATTTETAVLDLPVYLEAVGGTVTIGTAP